MPNNIKMKKEGKSTRNKNHSKTVEKLPFYEKVEKRIGDVFASLGRFISRHPWKILLVTIVINLALSVGFVKVKLVIDAETVYLPTGSQARQDEKQLAAIFPDTSRSNFRRLQMNKIMKWASVLIRSKDGNLLEKSVLNEIASLNDVISQIVAVNDDGKQIGLPQICSMVDDECYAEGSVFWSPEFLDAVEQKNVSFPWFETSNGLTNYKQFMGGIVDHDDTHLYGMEYIKIEFVFRTDVDITDDIITWCNEFLKVLDGYSANNTELTYAHYDSLDEELNKNVIGDIDLFSVTISIMATYSIIATVSSRVTDSVGQRVMLGTCGWLATLLSVASGIGLCILIGVEFVSIVGVVPFLVSGIGVDDMFILLSGLSGAQTQRTVSDKLAETMRVSGVGITITTLTDLLAFGCGASSTFISVRNFCIYTGVCVTFCYINNITILGAFIAINERRVEEGKHWFTWRTIETKEEAIKDGRKTSYILCCTGRQPTSRKEAESLFDKVPRWILPKIVLYKPLKLVICFLFVAYLGGAIYGCINLKQGVRFSELPSDTSYYYTYAKIEEDFFPRQSPVSFVITQPYDYSSQGVQNKIEAFMNNVKNDPLFEDDFESNWLAIYKQTPFYLDSDEESFIFGLELFLSHPRASSFINDVVINESKTKITSCRFYGRSRRLLDSQEEGDVMLRARELVADFDLECFAFYPTFILYEQYVSVLYQTLQTIFIALAVVLLVTFFFMPHPVLILFCTLAVCMIMLGVLGYMYYINVALSAITMVQIIMGIGFSVDFTAHICHGYMASTGKTRDLRVKGAIDKTGAPITHGAISSLLGIAVLGAAESYIFRTFASVLAFVLGFGWAHAVLLLPVVLSWVGPGTFEPQKPIIMKTRRNKRRRHTHYTNDERYPPYPAIIHDGYYGQLGLYEPHAYLGNAGGYRIPSSFIPMPNRTSVYESSFNENDKGFYNFDQKASVFKLYPNVLDGSYSWELATDIDGESLEKFHGI